MAKRYGFSGEFVGGHSAAFGFNVQGGKVGGWDAEGDDFGGSDHGEKWLTFVDEVISVS